MPIALLVLAANTARAEVGRGLSTGAAIAIMGGSLILVAIVVAAVWKVVAARGSRRPGRKAQKPGHAGRITS